MDRVLGWIFLASVGLVSAACGQSDSGNPAASGGAAAMATAGSGNAAGTNGAGGNAGSNASGGSSGGATAGAANAGAPGAVADFKTETGACVYYAGRYADRVAYCQGRSSLVGAWLYNGCPDLFFSEGSTRTVASVMACAEVWKDYPCEKIAAGEMPSCVTPGTKKLGDPCWFPSQCEALSCPHDQSTCGKCEMPKAPNAPCMPGDVCAGALSCQASAMCGFGRTVVPLGADCSANPCTPDAYCATDQKCKLIPLAGQDCSNTYCQTGNYCRSSDHTCQASPSDGQACGVTADGGLACAEGECDTTSGQPVCRKPAPMPEGSPCKLDSMPVCPAGQICAGSPALCRTPSAKGGPCSDFSTCKPGLDCDAGICKSRALPEQSCADGSTLCHPSSMCDGKVCQPLGLQGLFSKECQ